MFAAADAADPRPTPDAESPSPPAVAGDAAADPRPTPDAESPSPPAGAGGPEPTSPTSAVKPGSMRRPTAEGSWKAAGDREVGRREDVAAPAPATGGGELSPLSTTTGQLVLVLVVVGLVGGAVAAWTLRTSRR